MEVAFGRIGSVLVKILEIIKLLPNKKKGCYAMEKEQYKIFCSSGGCAAKLGPKILGKLLHQIPKVEDDNLLIGFDHSDDAAVYRLTDDIAMVQTLDFFPPMVEDPYLFGQIAATNALSDIYAMGGQVKTALNIVCFPENMDTNILGQILLGGSKKVQEAGGVLVGGHSISDKEIKYGLSVTGIVHPDKIYANHTIKPFPLAILPPTTWQFSMVPPFSPVTAPALKEEVTLTFGSIKVRFLTVPLFISKRQSVSPVIVCPLPSNVPE